MTAWHRDWQAGKFTGKFAAANSDLPPVPPGVSQSESKPGTAGRPWTRHGDSDCRAILIIWNLGSLLYSTYFWLYTSLAI